MPCFSVLGTVDETVVAACLSHDGSTLYVAASGGGIYTYDYPAITSNGLLESATVVPFGMAVDDAGTLYWWEDEADPRLRKRTSGGSVSTLYTDTASTSFVYGMVWHPHDGMLWVHHMGELWEFDPGSGARTVHTTDSDDDDNDVRPAPTSDGGLFWPVPVISPTKVRRWDIDGSTFDDSATLTALPFNEFLPVASRVWYPRDGAGRSMGAGLAEATEDCAADLPFFVFLYTASGAPVAYLDGADVYQRLVVGGRGRWGRVGWPASSTSGTFSADVLAGEALPSIEQGIKMDPDSVISTHPGVELDGTGREVLVPAGYVVTAMSFSITWEPATSVGGNAVRILALEEPFGVPWNRSDSFGSGVTSASITHLTGTQVTGDPLPYTAPAGSSMAPALYIENGSEDLVATGGTFSFSFTTE